ncbi:MAG: tetratricopeptide repeat protein, partial [Planctomycetia bacterium]|nr:tetratricopeptide repeat protein [Planctomycetia bacterium]
DFQREMTYSPDDVALLQELVHLQMRMNRYDRALATWQHLARSYSTQDEPAEVLYGKAYCMYRLRRLQDADDHLTLAMARHVDRPEFYSLLTQVCMEKGEYERAAQTASAAVTRFPQDETCRRSLEEINRQLVAGRQSGTNLN